jgi:hypothetical protein
MRFKSIRKKRKPTHSGGPHSAHGLGPMAMLACSTRWPKAKGVARLARPKAGDVSRRLDDATRHDLRVVTVHGTPWQCGRQHSIGH